MLKSATLQDLSFIYELCLQESRRYIFNPRISETIIQRFLFKRELKNIIKKKKRLSCELKDEAFILWKEDVRIGFSIISEDLNGDTELWLIALSDRYRCQGLGLLLTQLTLKYLSGENRCIYARCKYSAANMISILRGGGFSLRVFDDDIQIFSLSQNKRGG